jgi:serine/threonine-protein kinase
MVELLAGRHIVDGDHAAMMGTVVDPARRPTPRVEGVRVGDAVEAVFQRALALDPRDRFRDAGAFWNALLTAYDTDTEKRHSDPRMMLGPNRSPSGSSVARAHAQIPDLEIGSPSRSGHYTAPVSAAQSGRFPAKPSRDERESPDLPPQRSSSSSFAREAPSSDAGGESAGSGLELDSSPFTPSEADIPTAPSDPTGLSSLGTAPNALPVSSVPPAESISPQSASAPAAPRTSVPSRFSNFDDEPGNLNRLVSRFAAPAAMVALGVLITIIDGAYAAAHGEVFTLGPLRLAWVAAALVLTGIGLSLYRFLERPE